MTDHAVYHQQQGVSGKRKLEPLQKLSQAERLDASESLGGVWSWVELDGSLLGGGGGGGGPSLHRKLILSVSDGLGGRGGPYVR